MKYLSIILALLVMVACDKAEDNTNTPTPPNVETPEDENGEENGENGEDNGEEDNSWMDEVIDISDADCLYSEGVEARVSFVATNDPTLRNDYISLTDYKTNLTLYMDLYSPNEQDYITPGIYTFGDGEPMTVHREWSYVYDEAEETFMRFIDGRVKVIATPDETTGEVVYHITARFVNAEGKVIGADYEGTITPNGSFE
jgi:hypothetical protein